MPCHPCQAGATRANPSDKLNPQIQKIVREISAANIEATIRKLVGFGTRHALSETASDTRGRSSCCSRTARLGGVDELVSSVVLGGNIVNALPPC